MTRRRTPDEEEVLETQRWAAEVLEQERDWELNMHIRNLNQCSLMSPTEEALKDALLFVMERVRQ